MSVRIGEKPALEHLVQGRLNPRHQVARREGCLLCLSEEVGDISVED